MGSSSSAASTDMSLMACQPISDSPQVGLAAAMAWIRGPQMSLCCLIVVYPMTGLQVAPTPPYEIDWRSSSRSAESFHRAVGVVRAAVSSGPSVYSMVIAISFLNGGVGSRR